MKIFAVLAVLCIATGPRANALSDAAASMQAGEWREFTTTGFNQALLWVTSPNYGSGDCIFNYADDLVWYPDSQMILFVGGGHSTPNKHVIYSAHSNSWREILPQPGWLEGLGHGYDHSAMDEKKGVFYHMADYSRTIIYKYTVSTGVWATGAQIPTSLDIADQVTCCKGLEFFPDYDRGGLVIPNGKAQKVYWLGMNSGRALTLGTVLMGGYHNIAKYNWRHKVVLVGGGEGSNTIHRLDSTGALTRMKGTPFPIGIMSSLEAADPATGLYIVLTRDGTWHTYDILADTWTRQNAACPLFSFGSAGPIIFTAACPIPQYGVMAFAKYADGVGKIWLYKHAEMPDWIERARPDPAGMRLSAFPNPFGASVRITWQGPAEARVAVYGPDGRRVAQWAGQGNEWDLDASVLPPGVYLLEMVSGPISQHRFICRVR